jgi:hypothetical protein
MPRVSAVLTAALLLAGCANHQPPAPTMTPNRAEVSRDRALCTEAAAGNVDAMTAGQLYTIGVDVDGGATDPNLERAGGDLRRAASTALDRPDQVGAARSALRDLRSTCVQVFGAGGF